MQEKRKRDQGEARGLREDLQGRFADGGKLGEDGNGHLERLADRWRQGILLNEDAWKGVPSRRRDLRIWKGRWRLRSRLCAKREEWFDPRQGSERGLCWRVGAVGGAGRRDMRLGKEL